MRIFSVLLLLAVTASAAFAVVDPDADQMGLYFDPTGDVVCAAIVPVQVVPMYLLYTNPTLAQIRGFECSITKEGAGAGLTLLANTTYPVYALNIASHEGDVFQFIVGYSEPIPTAEATVLAAFEMVVVSADPVAFRVGPAQPASLDSSLPVILAEDYSLLPVGLSAPVGPSALINAPDCEVVDTDPTPWGSIKAMYHPDSDGEVSR